MKKVQKTMEAFVTERNWNKSHTPRNLILALQEELGELAQAFVWADTPEKLQKVTTEQKEFLSHEIGDVLSYLVSLATSLDIDIEDAFFRKLEINKKRFPVGMTAEEIQEYRKRKRK